MTSGYLQSLGTYAVGAQVRSIAKASFNIESLVTLHEQGGTFSGRSILLVTKKGKSSSEVSLRLPCLCIPHKADPLYCSLANRHHPLHPRRRRGNQGPLCRQPRKRRPWRRLPPHHPRGFAETHVGYVGSSWCGQHDLAQAVLDRGEVAPFGHAEGRDGGGVRCVRRGEVICQVSLVFRYMSSRNSNSCSLCGSDRSASRAPSWLPTFHSLV